MEFARQLTPNLARRRASQRAYPSAKGEYEASPIPMNACRDSRWYNAASQRLNRPHITWRRNPRFVDVRRRFATLACIRSVPTLSKRQPREWKKSKTDMDSPTDQQRGIATLLARPRYVSSSIEGRPCHCNSARGQVRYQRRRSAILARADWKK